VIERVGRAGVPDRSVGTLLRDIAARSERLVVGEIQLAAAKIADQIAALGSALAVIGAAVAAALLAGGFAMLGLARLLATAMPRWLAELVVAAIVGAAAAILIVRIARVRDRATREEPNG
jgi:hypothetical protein